MSVKKKRPWETLRFSFVMLWATSETQFFEIRANLTLGSGF